MNEHGTEEQLDIALAAELQRALLPKSSMSDCPHQVAATRNRMCGEVGGDFYDFIRLNDDQVACIIGDVVGHGVRASLVMAQIMGYLRSKTPGRSRPAEAVAHVNELLLELGGRIGDVIACSLFYAVMDAPSGLFLYINAGHPKPILCDNEKCFNPHLGPGNMLLGVERYKPEEGCHTFSPGERLILYTDGMTDAVNADGEHFGYERLHQAVVEHLGRSPDECAEAVFRTVEAYRDGTPPIDDETIVVIDRV